MASLLPPDELDQLANVDPEIGGVLEHMPPSRMGDLSPAERIKQMRIGFDSIPLPDSVPQVQEQRTSYTTRDGTTLRMLIYRPSSVSSPLPLFVWYHGGGLCIGRPEIDKELCQDIVVRTQCVVIAPQYRLAPEYKYPIPIDDSWDALQHIVVHAQDHGANLECGFVIGGESAGAVISSLLCLQARDKNLSSPITGAFLSAGSYLDPNNIPEKYKPHYRSRYSAACLTSPMLSKESKEAFDFCHQGDYSSPAYRSALAPNAHEGLPRTYFQTCGMDINRDETFIYQHILQESGVETKLDVYPGCPHCFWFMFSETEQGRKWKQDTQKGLSWLLAR